MRITLTLDDDLAVVLAELAAQTREPFNDVVNETLRDGLRRTIPAQKPFEIQPWPGKLRAGIDDRKLNELIWELDAEDFLESQQTAAATYSAPELETNSRSRRTPRDGEQNLGI